MAAMEPVKPQLDASRLISVTEALALILAGSGVVTPVRLPVGEALGHIAGETVLAPGPVPPRAVAQRSGIAVASAELVGASPYAPALLSGMPGRVLAGAVLPAGADAVLPADAASPLGALIAIGQSAYPGENVTLTGADLASGALIIREGERITRAMVLALEVAAIRDIAVRQPRFRLEADESPHGNWLREALQALGCAPSGAGDADFRIVLAGDEAGRDAAPAGIALRPGGGAGVAAGGGRPPAIILPARFDGAVAVFHALLLPLLARLTGQELHTETRPLTRKIASVVGFSDLALLRRSGEGYEPLAVGQVTLAALLATDAVALLPPESEGAAAGTPLAAIPINEPLAPIRA